MLLYTCVVILSSSKLIQSFQKPNHITDDTKTIHELLAQQDDQFAEVNGFEASFGKDGVNQSIIMSIILTFVLLYSISYKSIHTTSQAVLVTITISAMLFTIIFTQVLSFEGANTGLKYLFQFDASKLTNYKLWVDAVTQASLSNSLSVGPLYMMSRMKRGYQCTIKQSYYILTSNFLCQMLGALVVFSFIGHYTLVNGVGIHQIPTQDLKFAFMVLPMMMAGEENQDVSLWVSLLYVYLIVSGIQAIAALGNFLIVVLEDQVPQIKDNLEKTIFTLLVTVLVIAGSSIISFLPLKVLQEVLVESAICFRVIFLALSQLYIIVYRYGLKKLNT